MAQRNDLSIDQGADYLAMFPITGLGLSNQTASAQMRKYYSSNTSFPFTATIIDNNTIRLAMTANITASIAPGRYVYDCILTDNSGVVVRVMEGLVTVNPDVTRA